MKILITGIAGAIGSHLAERLIDMGHEVSGIDCITPYYSHAIKKINIRDVENKGAKVYIQDLATDPIDPIVANAQIIFHFAAQPGISAATPFEDFVKNNIVATERLLESAKKSGTLQMLFYISTSSVYGVRANGDEETLPQPTSFYGVTKLAAEQLALSYYRESDVPVSVLRLFSVYGERERPEKFFHRLIKAISEGKEVPFYDGSEYHVRSYTYVGDIVNACVLALGNLDTVVGEIFNVGNDTTATTGDAMKLVEVIMGQRARLKILPPRLGDQFETSANIKKIQRVLGYKPQFDLKAGLTAEVNWYKDKIHNKLT